MTALTALPSGHERRDLIWARWLIPIGFLVLGLPGVSPLPAADPAFTWLNVLCAAATALLAANLGGAFRDTLWAWILAFVLFVGYGLKTVIYARTLYQPELQLVSAELGWLTYGFLARAYEWVTAAVVMVCVACSALLRLQDAVPIRHHRGPRPEVRSQTLASVLAVTIVLSVLCAVLPLVLGFGLMGGAEVSLPFRLDAFITRYRTNLAPGLLLWVLWIADDPRHGRLWTAAMASLVLVALADAIGRASRGSLMLILIPAIMLWLITGRATTRRKAVGVSALGAVVALYPLISLQRQARMLTGVGAVEGLRLAREAGRIDNVTSIALLKISTRVSGADGWWHVLAHRGLETPAEWDARLARGAKFALDSRSIAVFNTERIVGIRIEGERRPPALLGALAMIGGEPSAALFMLPAYVLLVYTVWRGLARLSIAPVALAFTGNVLLFYSSEGGMGVQDPIACAVSLLLIAWVHRWAVGGGTGHPTQGAAVGGGPSGPHTEPPTTIEDA